MNSKFTFRTACVLSLGIVMTACQTVPPPARMVQTGDACVHAVTAFVLESTQRTSRLTPEIFQDSDTLTLQGGTVKDENGRLLNGEHKEKPQVFKLFRNSKNECEIKHENTARMSLLPTCNCEVIPPAPPSSTPSTPTTWMRENY